MDTDTVLAVAAIVAVELAIVLTAVPRRAIALLRSWLGSDSGKLELRSWLVGVLSDEALHRELGSLAVKAIQGSIRGTVLGDRTAMASIEKGLGGSIAGELMAGSEWGWVLDAVPGVRKWIDKHPEAALALGRWMMPGLIARNPEADELTAKLRRFVSPGRPPGGGAPSVELKPAEP